MEIHLTERAAAEYERISSGAMTPEMASEYLRDGRIQLRTFAESLREVYHFPDIGRRLTDSFLAFEPKARPGPRRRRWVAGSTEEADPGAGRTCSRSALHWV